jgi:hypothetical protein
MSFFELLKGAISSGRLCYDLLRINSLVAPTRPLLTPPERHIYFAKTHWKSLLTIGTRTTYES